MQAHVLEGWLLAAADYHRLACLLAQTREVGKHDAAGMAAARLGERDIGGRREAGAEGAHNHQSALVAGLVAERMLEDEEGAQGEQEAPCDDGFARAFATAFPALGALDGSGVRRVLNLDAKAVSKATEDLVRFYLRLLAPSQDRAAIWQPHADPTWPAHPLHVYALGWRAGLPQLRDAALKELLANETAWPWMGDIAAARNLAALRDLPLDALRAFTLRSRARPHHTHAHDVRLVHLWLSWADVPDGAEADARAVRVEEVLTDDIDGFNLGGAGAQWTYPELVALDGMKVVVRSPLLTACVARVVLSNWLAAPASAG